MIHHGVSQMFSHLDRQIVGVALGLLNPPISNIRWNLDRWKNTEKFYFYLWQHKWGIWDLAPFFGEARSGTITHKNQKRITAGTHSEHGLRMKPCYGRYKLLAWAMQSYCGGKVNVTYKSRTTHTSIDKTRWTMATAVVPRQPWCSTPGSDAQKHYPIGYATRKHCLD